jgi:hypothetical protein
MLIAIDFDGTLCERNEIPRAGDWRTCIPTENSIGAVKWLIEQGHQVYVLTARGKDDWKHIEDWLSHYGFPKLKITNIKLTGTKTLIDDRAIRFTSWLDICKYFG